MASFFGIAQYFLNVALGYVPVKAAVSVAVTARIPCLEILFIALSKIKLGLPKTSNSIKSNPFDSNSRILASWFLTLKWALFSFIFFLIKAKAFLLISFATIDLYFNSLANLIDLTPEAAKGSQMLKEGNC